MPVQDKAFCTRIKEEIAFQRVDSGLHCDQLSDKGKRDVDCIDIADDSLWECDGPSHFKTMI
jgi:hypothetical protein